VGYLMMLVRLPVVEPEELRGLLEQAWRMVAPKRLIREYNKSAVVSRQY
jgi:hypothetical protein